jgi:Ca2+-binding EF-hand superfamily protein
MKAIGPKYDKIHINKMFKLFDTNRNGLINFDEFIQSLQYPNADINMERGQRNIHGLKHHLLHSRIPVEGFLPLADTNRDYKMDEKEFNIVLDKINYKIAPEEVKEVFYCIDKNHSGLINA